jgi:hypothetical protein
MFEKISKTKLSQIHQVLLETKNDDEAATQLGVHSKTLQEVLKNCRIKSYHLSTKLLRRLSLRKASEAFGLSYHKPLQQLLVDINQYSVSTIHRHTRYSENIDEACSKLFISRRRLIAHLAQVTLDNKVLTFELLKSLSLQLASNAWGIMYDCPLEKETLYTNPYKNTALEAIDFSDDDEEKAPSKKKMRVPSPVDGLGLFLRNKKSAFTPTTTDSHQPDFLPDAGL